MTLHGVPSRRAKIVATLGPATDDLQVLADLIRAGADVVRVNFSHGSFEDHARRVQLVRDAAASVDRYVGVLGDLSGPKIRIDRFIDGKIDLVEGAPFTLDVSLAPAAGTQHTVGCAYKELPKDVTGGDVLLLNDGLIVLEVTSVEGPRVHTRVITGGELSNNKGLNRRGGGLSAGALTDKDRADIKIAARLEVDYLAVSFPRSAEDMLEARRLLREAGGSGRLVAKIERAEAIVHLDEIVEASDAVMVARGDLGVEVGYAELTGLQKQIIETARHHFKVVITATQMMESMIQNPVPTRAEVSDVANAVLDGTDAVMLSAESAVGQYPVKAVEAMAQVIVRVHARRGDPAPGHAVPRRLSGGLRRDAHRHGDPVSIDLPPRRGSGALRRGRPHHRHQGRALRRFRWHQFDEDPRGQAVARPAGRRTRLPACSPAATMASRSSPVAVPCRSC